MRRAFKSSKFTVLPASYDDNVTLVLIIISVAVAQNSVARKHTYRYNVHNHSHSIIYIIQWNIDADSVTKVREGPVL